MTNAQAVARYKIRHQDRVNTYQQKIRQEHKELLNSIKNKPCTDCHGWFNPWQMQFDHLPNFKKKFQISQAANRNIKALLTEIKKCEVVCSNCHDERTYRRIQIDY